MDGLESYVGTSRFDTVGQFAKFDLAEKGSLRRLLDQRRFSTIVNLIGRTSSGHRRGLTTQERSFLFSQFRDAEDLLLRGPKIIHVGSGAEYGCAKPPLRENSIPTKLGSYGAGKLEETSFFAGLAERGLDILVLRPSIVYGSSQKGDMLVPSVIKSLKGGVPPKLEDPLRVRDFLYEKDFARAVICAIKTDWKSGQIFNLGSGSPVRVQEFVAELSRVIWLKSDTQSNKDSPHHDLDLIPEMDTALIRKELGWEPRFDFKSAIADLVKTL